MLLLRCAGHAGSAMPQCVWAMLNSNLHSVHLVYLGKTPKYDAIPTTTNPSRNGALFWSVFAGDWVDAFFLSTEAEAKLRAK